MLDFVIDGLKNSCFKLNWTSTTTMGKAANESPKINSSGGNYALFWTDQNENATEFIQLICKLFSMICPNSIALWGSESLEWAFGSQVKN